MPFYFFSKMPFLTTFACTQNAEVPPIPDPAQAIWIVGRTICPHPTSQTNHHSKSWLQEVFKTK
jgi:hypothetical protein